MFDDKASITVAKEVVEVDSMKPVADPRFSEADKVKLAFVPLPRLCSQIQMDINTAQTSINFHTGNAASALVSYDTCVAQASEDWANMALFPWLYTYFNAQWVMHTSMAVYWNGVYNSEISAKEAAEADLARFQAEFIAAGC